MKSLGIVAAALMAATAAPAIPPAPACALPAAERQWIQRALNGWIRARDELLRIPPSELPWMVFFNGECAWHLAPGQSFDGRRLPADAAPSFAGRPVPVAAVSHGGTIRLPDGMEVAPEPTAFTSRYGSSGSAYFVIALPEMWRSVWSETDPPLEEFFLGVAAHELTHTEQMAALGRRIEALRARSRIVPESIDDDIIENNFRSDAAYTELFERERDLLYGAAFEPDARQARATARAALAIARQRRERFFVGEREVYRELEGLYLNLEGVGMWVSYKLSRLDPANFAIEERVISRGGRGTSWVQAHGLALVLLLDRLHPGWQRRLLAPELASPLELLETALAEGG